MSVETPWGEYAVILKGSDFQVKRIQIKPGLRFSLQKHFKRAEQWTIVSGEGVATVDGKEIPVKRSSLVYVPVQSVHRMHNTGLTSLVFIEVQFGEYLGEDDIVRLEDDFNRAK